MEKINYVLIQNTAYGIRGLSQHGIVTLNVMSAESIASAGLPDCFKPGYNVLIYLGLCKLLRVTHMEMHAVILHEIGHVARKHLEGKTGFINDLSLEIEADQFAVRIGMGVHLRAILTKSYILAMRLGPREQVEYDALAQLEERIKRLPVALLK